MPGALEVLVTRLRAAGCVFAEDEAALLIAAATGSELDALVARRASGEPLEHLLGWAEFCGLRVVVAPGVFVPRRRTELMVTEAVALVTPAAVVVELCCGSGAVAAALVAQAGPLDLHAVDVDPAAVRCARRNLPTANVIQGDLYDALPTRLCGHVDLLLVNAPYVPTAALATMPPEARLHEARVALDGGPDGLDVQRRVAADARGWLATGGSLLVETSAQQAPATAELLAAGGLVPRIVTAVELDATVVVASRI